MVRGPSAEATHTTCPAHYAESAPLFPRGLFLRGAQSAEAGSAGGTAYRHSAALRMPVASTRGGSAPAAPRLGDVWQRLLLFWWPRLGQGLLLASSG